MTIIIEDSHTQVN